MPDELGRSGDLLMLKMQDDGTPTRWRCLECEHEFDGPAVDVDRGAASVTLSVTVPTCTFCVERRRHVKAAGTPTTTIVELPPLPPFTAEEFDEIEADLNLPGRIEGSVSGEARFVPDWVRLAAEEIAGDPSVREGGADRIADVIRGHIDAATKKRGT